MNILATERILTCLSARYPGGIAAFLDDGGTITAIPTPSFDVVVCHPDLPRALREDFMRLAEETVGLPEPHPVLSRRENFDGMEPAQHTGLLYELMRFLEHIDPAITFADTRAALIIDMAGHDAHSDEVRRVTDYLETMRGVVLAYVTCRDVVGQAKTREWVDEPGTAADPRPRRLVSGEEIERLMNGEEEV
jgi:hypothetical protein